MTTTHRITTTAAVLLSLAAAGAQAASARPTDFVPASHQSPASVYSRPDKALIPPAGPVAGSSSTSGVPPILPRVTASQLATSEQAARQVAAYAPPKGSVYSNADTNAYADTASGHLSSGVAAATTPNAGFDWGDAGIGAAGGAFLAMLCLGGGLAIVRRRPGSTRHTTALPN